MRYAKVADRPAVGKGPKRGSGYTIESVARAMDVLAAFERPPHQFGVSELARHLGLTKNLVFRLLRTLEAQGFVLRVGEGTAPQYAIGMRLFDLSRHAVDRQQALREIARPYLEELKRLCLETSYLVVLDDLDAVFLDRVESDLAVRQRVEVGQRVPLTVGGGTKAMLAFLPRRLQETILRERLRPLTPATPADPDEVRRSLARIRQDGYWIALAEFVEDVDGIGAAVFDATGAAVAGVGVSGPSARLRARLVSPELRDPLLNPILDAALAISRALGYDGPYPAPWLPGQPADEVPA